MNRSMKQMLSMLLVVAMMAAMLVIPGTAATGTDSVYTLKADAVTVKVDETADVKVNVVYGVNDDTYTLAADTTYEVTGDAKAEVVTYSLANDTLTITVKGVEAGTAALNVKIGDVAGTVNVTVEAAEEPSAAPSAEPSTEPSQAPAPEAKPMTAGNTYTLDFGEVFTATEGNAAWRDSVNNGTEGRYNIVQDSELVVNDFTVYSKKEVSGSTAAYIMADARTFSDGYNATYAINFGDSGKFLDATVEKAPGENPNAVIGFTTTDKATVKVWWYGGGTSRNRTVGILQPDMTAVESADFYNFGAKILQEGPAWASGMDAQVTTFELDAAGTYYVGNVRNGNRIYKVEVVVGGATEPSTQPSTQPSTEPSTQPSQAPMTVYTVKPDATTATVRVNGTKTVDVTTEPANGEVYVVSADATVVTATVAENVLTLKGVKEGKTTVVLGVKDGEGTAEVVVTVRASSSSGGGSSSGGTTTTKPAGDYTAKKTTDRNGNVTITVTDKDGAVVATVEIPATIPTLSTKFVDVPDDHWAAKSINDLAALSLVNGVAENTYDMNSNVTRGSLATILFRLAQAKGAASDFTDVAADAWYADAVGWAAKVGIIAGKGDNTFGADESITREQLAVMLYRFAKLLGADTRATGDVAKFADGANTSDWAQEAMTWAVGAGILVGNTANELNPTAAASRAETACMVDRFISLLK